MIDYLTITEAATRLHRSRQLIHRWVKAGRIKSKRIAGRHLIDARHCKLPVFLPPGRKS